MIGISSFILIYYITEQAKKDIWKNLENSNHIVAKNIKNVVTNYKESFSSLSKNQVIIEYADSIETTQNDYIECKLNLVNEYLDELSQKFKDFLMFNITDLEGNIIASSNKDILKEKINVKNNDYFKKTIQGKIDISRPFNSRITGKQCFAVSIPLENSRRNIVGIFFGIISTEKMTEKTVKDITIGTTGYSYLIDSESGFIFAHKNEDKIEKINMFENHPWLRLLRPGGNESKVIVSSEKLDKLFTVYYEPVSNFIIASTCLLNEIDEKKFFIKIVITPILFVSTFIVGLILFFIVRNITNRIIATNTFAAKISQGDFSASLKISNNDEIGELATSLKNMVSTLQQMIEKSEHETERIQIVAQKAKKAGDQARKKEEIIREEQKNILSIASELENLTQNIKSEVQSLVQQIDNSSLGAKNSEKNLVHVTNAMAEINKNVQNVASTTQETAVFETETSETAKEGTLLVDHCIKTIEETNEATQSLRENMQELNQYAKDINKITTVITDIADQTNLLALNAAIEAARAGDAGRGFAVVADEVRKLAEKTMTSTNDVDKVTHTVQESAKKSMEAVDVTTEKLQQAMSLAKESGIKLHEIVEKIEQSNEKIKTIANAAKEQAIACETVDHLIENCNELSVQNSEAMEKAYDSTKILSNDIVTLVSMTDRLKNSTSKSSCAKK